MFLFSIARDGILWPRHFHLPAPPDNDNYGGVRPLRAVREDEGNEDTDEVPSGLITLY